MNTVLLVGYVGKDPDTRTLRDGTTVAKFRLATSKTWHTKDGAKREETQWHSVTAFGRLAEVIRSFVRKGRLVCVRGELRYSEYTREGHKHLGVEIQADTVRLLGSGSSSAPSSAPSSTTDDAPAPTWAPDEAVPDPGEDPIPF